MGGTVGAAGLRAGDDREGASLVSQVSINDRLEGRPGLIDVELLETSTVSRVIGRFANHGRTVWRDHDVILVGQTAQGGNVAIIDRLQVARVESGDRGEVSRRGRRLSSCRTARCQRDDNAGSRTQRE